MFKYFIIIVSLFLQIDYINSQVVVNGSVTGSPVGNNIIANATGWSRCGFSPDLCSVSFPSYVTTSGVTPAASPDGGSWLGIASLGECAQTTITGLVPGNSYTLYFCGACFGTGTSIYNGGPARPIVTVVGATGGTQQFTIPQAALVWNGYQLNFTATATSHTLQVSHPNVTPQAYASLDGFSLSNPCGILLPVELFDFTAKKIETNNVLLNWKTLSEKNCDYFSIERSTNGIDFVEISKLQAAVNSSTTLYYEYIDNNFTEFGKVYYYRIKTVDLNNFESISEVKAIELPLPKNDMIYIYPNPSDDILNIDFTIDEIQNTEVKIYDSLGQLVFYKRDGFRLGKNYLKINIKDFAAGYYMFELTTRTYTSNQKFIKK